MSYRYTDTCKWSDPWYYSLNPLEKLTFNYLCDNCDIAGFIELNLPKWASEIGVDQSKIKAALEGLQRGFIFSPQKDCLYIRNFLKHQKNLPLNENNPAHRGIISRFSSYSYKFDFEDINEFIKGASKGLVSPIGNGNGIGNGKSNGNELVKKENNVSKKNECKINAFPEKLNTEKIRKKFDEWVTHRKGLKKVKSWDILFNSQIEWLSQFSESEILEILTNSIINGYQGLFPPKNKPNQNNLPRYGDRKPDEYGEIIYEK